MARRARRQHRVVRLKTFKVMGEWITEAQLEGMRSLFVGEAPFPGDARTACMSKVMIWVSDNEPNTLIQWEDLVL